MREWHELVGRVDDVMPGGVGMAGLVLLVVTGLVALLWYTWPVWLRFFRPRRRGADDLPDREIDDIDIDETLPDRPAAELAASADALAAQGRYREAVRERLRAIVRELVERGIVDSRPGWTVTELAQMAARTLPPAAPPLAAASDIFSRIWYGQRAAGPADDAAMREHAAAVRATLPAVRAGA